MVGLACVLFLDLGSIAFQPWWVVGVLVGVWLALLLVALAWWTPRPTLVPWVAAAGVAVWLVALAVRVALA